MNVSWFTPRAEPHISLEAIYKYGCSSKWSYRPNQEKVFKSIQYKIYEIVEEFKYNINLVSQIDIFKFDLSKDFTNCKNLFWSDSDHFTSFGEVFFSKRLPDNFIK